MSIKVVKANNIAETDQLLVDEIIPISWDFASELVTADNEEIVSATVEVTDSDGEDVTEDVVPDDVSILTGDSVNSKVVFVVHVLAATTYKAEILATVSDVKVLKSVIYIPCRDI